MTMPDTSAGGERRMGPIYAAVIVVEVATLVALWWFQTAFSR